MDGKLGTVLFLAGLFLCFKLEAVEHPDSIIKQEFIINASVTDAWEVLGPGYADIRLWASSVKNSSADDNERLNDSPCLVRSCSVSGIGHVKEKLIEYLPDEHTISYQVIEGNPKPIKYVAITWKLVDLGNEKSKLEITVELKTGGFIGTIFNGPLKKKVTKLYSETADEFKYYVENGKPLPDKVKVASMVYSAALDYI